jgi:hypothetical protein
MVERPSSRPRPKRIAEIESGYAQRGSQIGAFLSLLHDARLQDRTGGKGAGSTQATRSHHFDVLRDAGVIFTRCEGTKCMTSLRKAELNKCFPGLLRLISTRS